MPVCCRCNGSGRCKACSCVKSGRQCVNCLPARNGHCSNLGILTSVNPEQTSSIIQDPSDAFLESALNVAITVDLTPPPALPMPLSSRHTSPTTRNLPDVHTTRDPSDAIFDSPSSVSLTTVDRTPPPSLPAFKPMSCLNCTWGDLSGQECSNALDNAYSLTVNWRPNLFKVPSGSSGKHFVCELARLFEAFATESALEPFAMTAAMTFPALMLQKPHAKSETRGPYLMSPTPIGFMGEGRYSRVAQRRKSNSEIYEGLSVLKK